MVGRNTGGPGPQPPLELFPDAPIAMPRQSARESRVYYVHFASLRVRTDSHKSAPRGLTFWEGAGNVAIIGIS